MSQKLSSQEDDVRLVLVENVVGLLGFGDQTDAADLKHIVIKVQLSRFSHQVFVRFTRMPGTSCLI